MSRANIVLLLILVAGFSVLAVPSKSVAADSRKSVAVDSPALAAEAEALLDEWRGQTQILDLAAQKLYQALKGNPNYSEPMKFTEHMSSWTPPMPGHAAIMPPGWQTMDNSNVPSRMRAKHYNS